MRDGLAFLAAFLRNPAATGAIAPSSASLARAMVAGLEVSPGETIVEFGPGTGPFTEAIRQILPSADCYLGIEREARFVAILRGRYPELRVVEGSAEDARRHLAEAGRRHVRAVLCGLPFASFPPRVQDRVVDALDALVQPGAEFRTFQYVHAYGLPTAVRFRRRMAGVFGPHRRQALVFRNLPPAFVLRWARGDGDSRTD
jgi:phosphatidylethanolamine/phosphatidyl-N-methylethanolamine N-methyltransferase